MGSSPTVLHRRLAKHATQPVALHSALSAAATSGSGAQHRWITLRAVTKLDYDFANAALKDKQTTTPTPLYEVLRWWHPLLGERARH